MKGKMMYEEHHAFHQQFTNEISGDLTLEQIATLTEQLDKLLKRI